MLDKMSCGILRTPRHAVELPVEFDEIFVNGAPEDISSLYRQITSDVGTTKDWRFDDELPIGSCIDESMNEYGLGIDRAMARSIICRVNNGLVQMYLPLCTSLLSKDGSASSFRDMLLIPRDTGLLVITAGKYCVGMLGSDQSDWEGGAGWREYLQL